MSKAEDILGAACNFPQYQKGYLNIIKGTQGKKVETSCNLFSRDALDGRYVATKNSWAGGIGGLISDWNYDITPINPKGSIIDCILNTPIPIAYRNLNEAAKMGIIIDCCAEYAQKMASAGELIHVISVMMNHEAIVIPDADHEFDIQKGCRIANVGAHNGIMYMSDKRTFGAFKDWNRLDIKYYLYRRV